MATKRCLSYQVAQIYTPLSRGIIFLHSGRCFMAQVSDHQLFSPNVGQRISDWQKGRHNLHTWLSPTAGSFVRGTLSWKYCKEKKTEPKKKRPAQEKAATQGTAHRGNKEAKPHGCWNPTKAFSKQDRRNKQIIISLYSWRTGDLPYGTRDRRDRYRRQWLL